MRLPRALSVLMAAIDCDVARCAAFLARNQQLAEVVHLPRSRASRMPSEFAQQQDHLPAITTSRFGGQESIGIRCAGHRHRNRYVRDLLCGASPRRVRGYRSQNEAHRVARAADRSVLQRLAVIAGVQVFIGRSLTALGKSNGRMLPEIPDRWRRERTAQRHPSSPSRSTHPWPGSAAPCSRDRLARRHPSSPSRSMHPWPGATARCLLDRLHVTACASGDIEGVHGPPHAD